MSDSLADMLALAEYWSTQETRAKQKKLQDQYFNEFQEMISGNYDFASSPMYPYLFSEGKSNIEKQYGTTKENILGGLPRGGTQFGALSNLEEERAKAAGSLPSMISTGLVQDMMDKAYGNAFGPGNTNPVNTMVGSIASGEMQNINNQAMQNQLFYGGLGDLSSSLMMMQLMRRPQNSQFGAGVTSTNPNWNIFDSSYQPSYLVNY